MSFLLKLVVFAFGINFLVTNHCLAFSSGSKYKQMRVESNSQASQDEFVHLLLYEVLDKQDEGYYLEIGSSYPISGNNSYTFEKNFGWKGVSIDIADPSNAWFSIRQNPLLIEDATQSDYQSILKPFPPMIDYLSLDIDCCYDAVLRRISFHEHVFKVITIEHDFYIHGDKYREDERRILESLGYYLLCPDVVIFFNGRDCVFEDWWIHPSAFPSEILSALTSLDLKAKNHLQIINTIRDYWRASKMLR